MVKINLSESEYIYLCEAGFVQNRHRESFFSAKKNIDTYVISLSESQADELRDLCGEQLQIAGFDENYELTDEGKILESLVDKLFTG